MRTEAVPSRAGAADHRKARAPTPARRKGLTSRPWWPAAKRGATFVFFGAVLLLLFQQARNVDWSEVTSALRGYSLQTLLVAAGLAICSHALYSTYDLIGRHETGHSLHARQVATVGLISYAFNLNLGSLVGGFAFRYRLYSRFGLRTGVITRVLSLSLLTNWLGYLVLAGTVFLLRPLALPPDWKLGSGGLQILGAALLLVASAYLLLCGFSKRRSFQVRGHELNLPSGRVALLQLALSSVSWLLIAGVVYVLLQQKFDYPTVLSVLLIAAVAGVITHVPAGLGVLEAVFVALLSHKLGQGPLLAALLAYRAIYYLAPLVFATGLFIAVDAKAKKAARNAGEAGRRDAPEAGAAETARR
jgi:glycosyltransferase 2 family protein